MKTLIKNGIIVTALDEYTADIVIDGEVISAIGKNLKEDEYDKVIDASGYYVLPGGVDQHTHYAGLNSDGKTTMDTYDCNYAALIGGTTTTVDFCPNEAGMGLLDSIKYRIEHRAKGKTCTDFGLHSQVGFYTEDLFDEIAKLPELGVSTMKLFMAFKPGPQYMDDGVIYKAMKACREAGITMSLHCENADLVNVLRKDYGDKGCLTPKYHYLSRPPFVEAEATQRALILAEAADCPLCIVHISCEAAAKYVEQARANGQKVIGETCNNYLALDNSKLDDPDFDKACRFVCSPALRDKADQDYLWKALKDDVLSVVASDHCGIPLSQKYWGKNDFRDIPNGCPGAAQRLSTLWTFGVEKGRISKQRLVDLYATTPAKICGMYPRKGTIAVGSDADLVLWNANWVGVTNNEDFPSGVDYNICEGLEQIGRAEKVLLRGKVVVDDCKFVGEIGGGQFIPGKAFGLAYDL